MGIKFKVARIEDLKNYNLDLVVVTSNKYFEDIRQNLIDNDIPETKIISLYELGLEIIQFAKLANNLLILGIK